MEPDCLLLDGLGTTAKRVRVDETSYCEYDYGADGI
jgi:hypothetical protein